MRRCERAARAERGQGTVEYVALILLVAVRAGRRGRRAASGAGRRRRSPRRSSTSSRTRSTSGKYGLSGGRPAPAPGAPGSAYHGARWPVPARRSARAPDRRLRLRRRRADRAARAARPPAARGLRLPRRHRALPVRRRARRAELERFALEIAEELLARGAKLLVVACNSATAAALPALRARMLRDDARASTCSASCGPRPCRRSRRRTTGASGCSPRRPRWPAAPTRARSPRSTRSSSSTAVAVPGPRADHPGRLAVRRARGRDRARLRAPLREAGVDTVILGCTHYPLVRADAPAHARPRRRDRSPPARAVARQVEHVLARARPRAARASRRGRLPLPVHRRRRGLPRARHALPAAAARRGRARRRCAREAAA